MVQACFTIPTRTARRRASTRRRAPPRRRAPVRRVRSSSRRTTRRSATSRRPQRQLSKYELVNLNPFDARCFGVKIPDSNTQPSETTVDENRVVISTDATTNAQCTAFMPYMNGNAVAATGASALGWNWVATFGGNQPSANIAEIQADYVAVRPVGHGIRLSCSSAPLNVTGFVHICIVPNEQFLKTTWAFPTSVSQMNNQPWYRRFTLASLTQRSVTVVNKFLDATATRYQDSDNNQVASSGATAHEFQFGNSWCAIIVAIEGAPPSSSPITVQTIVHYEGLPKIGTANSSTPAAQYNVRELQDVSRIATTHPGTFEEGQETELIANAMRDLFGVYTASSGPSYMGGIMGVNTPRLTQS